MWKIKENSIILEISLLEFRLLNQFAKEHHRISYEDEVNGKVASNQNGGTRVAEIFEPAFYLLPYFNYETLFTLAEMVKKKEADDETKDNLIKLSKNSDFRNYFLLNESYEIWSFYNILNCNVTSNLLINSNIKLNLNDLGYNLYQCTYHDDFLLKLLEFRSLHFSEQEIDDYYDRKYRIFKGLEFPSMEDFKMDWTYIWDNNEIKILGYKGGLEKVRIPKKLNDGTIISKISNHVLSQDNDEFLYVKTKINDIYHKYSNMYYLELEELKASGEYVETDYPPKNTLQAQLSSDFLTMHNDYTCSKSTKTSFVEVLDYVAPPSPDFSDVLRLFDEDMLDGEDEF